MSMRLVSVRNILAFALVCAALAILNAPMFLYMTLSPDGELRPETRVEAQVLRLTLAAAAIALAFMPFIWKFARNSGLRRAIENDFNDFRETWNEENTYSRALLLSWLGVMLATFAGLLFTMKWSFTYQGKNIFWYDFIALEDGVWEMETALGLLAAGVVIIGAALKYRPQLSRPMGLFFPMLLGFMFIFAAGEEMSWGQRWLGYATPEAIKAINMQEEFTLHNTGGRWANQVMILFFIGYIGLSPILARFFVDVRFLFRWTNIPLAPLSFAPFAFIGVLMDERATFSRIWGNPPWFLDEGRETLFGVAVLGTALCWAHMLAVLHRPRAADCLNAQTPAVTVTDKSGHQVGYQE